jgi:hypothetical protein
MRTSEKPDKAKFAFWGFCEVRIHGVLRSSPVYGVLRSLSKASRKKESTRVKRPPLTRCMLRVILGGRQGASRKFISKILHIHDPG